MTTKDKKEIGREFRFALHIPAKSTDEDDYHFVKEQVHYEVDGEKVIEPTIRIIKNYKRPVYFTKPHLRTYKDKREFEKMDRLNVEMVRQSEVKHCIARQLNNGYFNPRTSIRDLAASPYVYAADIPSTLFLRQSHYATKWPDLSSRRTVATFDTETDMLHGHEQIIISTICFENKAIAIVQKDFLEGFSNIKELFDEAISKHLKRFIEEKGLEIHFHIADSEIDVVKMTFEQVHAWRPDFLAIWNINFDIPKVLKACERAGVDPKDILCDPALQRDGMRHLRVCDYKEGITKKVSASGVKQTIKPANQWHVLNLTASFFVICSMATYRRVRGGAELSSYALDAILKREIKESKITIPEAEKYKKGKWHQFMQAYKKFDYIAYALFDSYSMILLDLKTNDLGIQLPLFADNTALPDYSSQARRQRDNFFLYGMENGIVLGTAGPIKKKVVQVVKRRNDDDEFEGEDEEDDKDGEPTTLDTKNWVITLRAFMAAPGLRIVTEDKNITTLGRTHVYDNDVVSSYPNCIYVGNVSKYTTILEVTGIRWSDAPVPELTYRMQNLNFVFGPTNHAEYAQKMTRAPTYTELRQMMLSDIAKEKEKEPA